MSIGLPKKSNRLRVAAVLEAAEAVASVAVEVPGSAGVLHQAVEPVVDGKPMVCQFCLSVWPLGRV